MARIRQHLHYSDTKEELCEYKAARRGATEDALWDEEELIDYRPASKRKKPKKKRGCPENNYKEHVYVWETEVRYGIKRTEHGWVTDRSRSWAVNVKKCCGCGKVANRKYHW